MERRAAVEVMFRKRLRPTGRAQGRSIPRTGAASCRYRRVDCDRATLLFGVRSLESAHKNCFYPSLMHRMSIPSYNTLNKTGHRILYDVLIEHHCTFGRRPTPWVRYLIQPNVDLVFPRRVLTRPR